MPTNSAAWLLKKSGKEVVVRSAPYTKAKEHEIVVKNHALAVNPVDWKICLTGNMLYTWLKYPVILGYDVAGEVVEVGPAVTRFKVGDRVVSFTDGLAKQYNDPSKGAFQLYSVCLDHVTTEIPDSLSYEQASVIPLGLSTAACGLFGKKQLALQLPSITPSSTGKTVLVWGGSTSVGCNAIQLAVAAGYEVITTCSPRNFELVKRLGATMAFDYNSKTIVSDLAQAFKGKTVAGALTLGAGGADVCLEILPRCNGVKSICMASFPVPDEPPKYFPTVRTIWGFATWSAPAFLKAKVGGIQLSFVVGDALVFDDLGSAIYVDFLPKALANGSFLALPEPLVVGKGLEYVQEAMNTNRKGVSAKKVVVTL